MNARRSELDVAITGYSHRMPGDIRSDDAFWRLLSEREIVQEPMPTATAGVTGPSADSRVRAGSRAPGKD